MYASVLRAENAPGSSCRTTADLESSSLGLSEAGNSGPKKSLSGCQTTGPTLTLCNNTPLHRNYNKSLPITVKPLSNDLEYSPSHASGQEPTSGPPSLSLGRDTPDLSSEHHGSNAVDAINIGIGPSETLSTFLLQPVNDTPWTVLRTMEMARPCNCRVNALIGTLGERPLPPSTGDVFLDDQMDLDFEALGEVTHDGYGVME